MHEETWKLRTAMDYPGINVVVDGTCDGAQGALYLQSCAEDLLSVQEPVSIRDNERQL